MGSALTLGLAGWLALRGQGTVGVAYTFLSYTFNLSFALTQLSSVTGEGPADPPQDIAATRCKWALFVSLPSHEGRVIECFYDRRHRRYPLSSGSSSILAVIAAKRWFGPVLSRPTCCIRR